MQLLQVLRDTTVTDCVTAVRVVGSALALTLLLTLLASVVFLVLFLPLAVLATLNPTLMFGAVPPTEYPTSYLGVQAVWTVLFGFGLFTAIQKFRLSPEFDTDTQLPDAYPPTTRNEQLAGLINTVESDE